MSGLSVLLLLVTKSVSSNLSLYIITSQYFRVVSWPLFVRFLENLFLLMFMTWVLIQCIERIDWPPDLQLGFLRPKRKKSFVKIKLLSQFLDI